MYWIEEGILAWRFNASVLEKNINNILQAVPPVNVDLETLFLRGGQSNYILPEDYPSIENGFPNATFQSIEKAGHWVHAEAPQEFLSIILAFLEVVKSD
jgi:pimeloyl-ACP methyl ester carboxylesterase